MPENFNIVRNVNNSIKQDKFKNKRESGNDCKISKTYAEYIGLNKIKNGKIGSDIIRADCKSTEVNTIKSEYIKLNKSTVGTTKSTTLTKQKVCKSITGKTGRRIIKPQKLKKQTNSKHIKINKTRSECVERSKLRRKQSKSASEHRADEIESSFNLLEVPLACGDFCFQADTNQDNKLIVLYENYSHVSRNIHYNLLLNIIIYFRYFY